MDSCWNAVAQAETPRIHVFISASEIHMAHQLRKNREDVMEMARAAVARARSYCEDVEFSPMDATRSDDEFVYQLLQAAIEEGATTVNVPDTVGYALPQEFGALIAAVRANVPDIDRARISVHCHNDLGMATANSLAGVLNGARQVEGAINGIGERAGNTSIEEVIMAISTRGDFGHVHTDVKTDELYRASRIVERVSGMAVQSNKAVVGRNAFRHSSGIHQDGVLKLRETYEIMDPSAIGIPVGDSIVLTKVSGRHGLRARINDLGVELDDEALDRVYEAFKEVADRKDEVDDRDLQAILAEQASVQVHDQWQLDLVQVSAGDHSAPTATVRLTDGDGEPHEDAAHRHRPGGRHLPRHQPRRRHRERADGVQRQVGDRGHRRRRRGHDPHRGVGPHLHRPRRRHRHPGGLGARLPPRAEPADQRGDAAGRGWWRRRSVSRGARCGPAARCAGRFPTLGGVPLGAGSPTRQRGCGRAAAAVREGSTGRQWRTPRSRHRGERGSAGGRVRACTS